MNRATRTLAGLAVGALIPLAAACGSHDQGVAERATAHPAAGARDSSPDCSTNSTMSQADWMAKCATESPTPSASVPNTELAVGDTFAYNDGVKMAVNSIKTLTKFGEYDVGPDPDEYGFRITWTITNGTKKPLSLDDWSVEAEGASSGGSLEMLTVDDGSKEMTGRIAAGGRGTFTGEYAIHKADGKSIVVTATRLDTSDGLLDEDPHWTGDIQ
ncbi:hypothetical protein AB0910_12535 [Streptomyces sp. NPDC047002]|uniref:hypothetical protein n=1 Tax=Streptomyces sp. NPDC047002 TaxID=3155475 RepID=UPI003454F6EB